MASKEPMEHEYPIIEDNRQETANRGAVSFKYSWHFVPYAFVFVSIVSRRLPNRKIRETLMIKIEKPNTLLGKSYLKR